MTAAIGAARVTTETRQRLARIARSELARRSFPEFCRQSWETVEGGTLEWTPFHEGLAQHLQAIAEGWLAANDLATPRQLAHVLEHWARHGLTYVPGEVLVQNTNINMAPGTLKSIIAMVMFPAWIWLHAPKASFACASSNDEVVKRDSDACRELVTSAWYRSTFGVPWMLKFRIASTQKWATTAGGIRRSRTILSGFIGLHQDFILVDDPDEPARVFNEAVRRVVRRKWSKSVETRVNHEQRSIRILLQQRVHAEDMSAFIRQQSTWSPDNRAGWAMFIVPMEAGRGPKEFAGPTVFGWTDPRAIDGELMQPRRFPPSVIADKKKKLGTHGFESQYNQNPESLDGGLFSRSWFRFFTYEGQPLKPHEMPPRPDGCRKREDDPPLVLPHKAGKLDLDFMVISVDATFGSTDPKKSSKVGLLVGGGKDAKRFIFDDRTKEMTYLDTMASIRALVAMWPARRLIIELKANGAAIVEQLERDIADAKILGGDGKPVIVVVDGWNPGNDSKIARARTMMPTLEQGLVFLLDGAHWLEPFLKEVCVFPNAPGDDRVDAMSQMLVYYGAEYSVVLRARAAAKW